MEAERSLLPKQICMLNGHTTPLVQFTLKTDGPYMGITLARLQPATQTSQKKHASHCKTHSCTVGVASSPKCNTCPAHTANTEKYLTYTGKAVTKDPQQGPSRICLLHPMWGASGAPPVIQLVSSELCGVGLFQLE